MASTTITGKDVQALASKLREWGKTLSEQEQAILGHVIEKAVSMTDAELDGVAGGLGVSRSVGVSGPLEIPGGIKLGPGKILDHGVSPARKF